MSYLSTYNYPLRIIGADINNNIRALNVTFTVIVNDLKMKSSMSVGM